MENHFTLRIAQLDLARQKETPEFIREFVTTMADCGYTSILLYLEDRIRTASYPYSSDEDSYTPDQIRALVTFAQEKNIELIPCVSTLGHAERFLRHPELAALAEVRGDMLDRFKGKAKKTFCISNPDFYSFIEKYLSEVAALFPSQYFHIGLDEFWDFNLCPLCRKKMKTWQQEGNAFLKHIGTIREIMARSGKRVMMWSDMFEYYPDIFPQVPNDIIMIDWLYQQDVRFYLDHLFDLTIEDRFNANKANGFDTIIAPNDMSLSCGRTYLEYAREAKPFGFFMTGWEKTDTFYYHTFPIYVYAGYLSQNYNDDNAFEAMMQQLFQTNDTILSAILRQVLNTGFLRHFSSISENTLFTRDFFGLPYPEIETTKTEIVILSGYSDKIKTELGQRIIADTLNALEEKLLSFKFKKLFQEALDHTCSDPLLKSINRVKFDLSDWLTQQELHWSQWRSGILPNIFALSRQKLMHHLNDFIKMLLTNSFCKLLFCLPDGYGIESCSLEVLVNGEWRQFGGKIYKADSEKTALFYRFVVAPLSISETPDALRITASGMGGFGLCYVEIRLEGKRYIPKSILETSGKISNEKYLLQENANFTWFGSQSTRKDYFDSKRSEKKHSVTINLKRFKQNKKLGSRL